MARACLSWLVGLAAALSVAPTRASAAPAQASGKPARRSEAGLPKEPARGPGGQPGTPLADPGLGLIGQSAPSWEWRQVLASPRIGGRLTAVTVDPRDPRRIYVGTEEGAVVSTADGGLTWDERQLSPAVVQARSFASRGVGPPDPADADSARIDAGKDPPERFYADDLSLPYLSDLVLEGAPFPGMGFPPDVRGDPEEASLLLDAVASRAEEVVPVKRIVICPGGRFPLLVATTREVYGSTDDGVTTLRLFFVTGEAPIEQIACAPWNPNDIAVASEKGVFRSTDGGLSFAEVLTGAPGFPSTAVTYARDPEKRTPVLYVSTWGSIYRGDPDSPEGLEYIYPPDDDSEAVPWGEIRKIEVTRAGEVWLATDDGVRYSRDGKTWLNIEPRLFGGRPVLDVKVDAQERVAVLTKDWMYVSDDEGATFQPFFYGLTRRSHRGVAWARERDGRVAWWVVTNGELWSSARPARPLAPRVDREASAWARDALGATPSLATTLERVLDATGLSAERIEGLARRHAARAFLPLVDLRLTAASEPFLAAARGTPAARAQTDASDRSEVEVLVQLTWPFFEERVLAEEAGPVREALYQLRRQIAFAAEDAWHERALHLGRLAEGLDDAREVAVAKDRVAALEAILDQWDWRRTIGR